MERIVEFESEGAILRGKLFTPEGAGPHPALVMAHGTSATIPMVLEQYARELHAAGFMVLAYDHRNFGISDGEPRQEINPWTQARGYHDAVSFVLSLPETAPERVAIWGDSFAGMQALVVAALDPRIAAVVAHVPSCGAELPPLEPTAENFKQLRDIFDHGDVSATRDTTTGPLPVVSPDQLGTPSLVEPIQAFRWFIKYGGRAGSGWQNLATRVIPVTPVPFSPYLIAPFLKADLLMLVAPDDEMARANPKVSRATFDLVPGFKRWVEIDGGHFGALYHPGERFERAVAAQRAFSSSASSCDNECSKQLYAMWKVEGLIVPALVSSGSLVVRTAGKEFAAAPSLSALEFSGEMLDLVSVAKPKRRPDRRDRYLRHTMQVHRLKRLPTVIPVDVGRDA